jgi:adenine-specific DNA-methyltransferase
MEQHKSSKELVNNNILEYIDLLRIDSSRKIHHLRKSVLSQYFSDVSLSRLMASMFSFKANHIRILDPGAGIGSLFAACVEVIIKRRFKPERISITAYEIDELFYPYLNEVFRICSRVCNNASIKFEAELIQKDFILDSAERLGLLSHERKQFNYIIMNPPYGKINISSKDYKVLKGIGLETTNYYAAFVSIAAKLLQEKGEMVSITPRSFCNGPYFKSFRKRLFNVMQLKRIHLFNSRTTSFRQDNVLQENIIFYSIKGKGEPGNVIISSSDSPQDKYMTVIEVKSNSVISPDDPEAFIRIIPDEINSQIARKMSFFKSKLEDLNLHVSTGKIVDFRAIAFLRQSPSSKTVPLIHPANLSGGFVKWPLDLKKPAYVITNKEIKNLLVPNGNYVLTKRFTTNEEKKRIVASVFDASRFDFPLIGFENRVNYFHQNAKGMDMFLAKGLAAFLNSTLVDLFFRQFNGHTQVNATDLRNLYYPTQDELKSLGKHISNIFPSQTHLDEIVERQLFNVSEKPEIDPVAAKQKIDDALTILKILDLPREQYNERSALTLLSLLDLKPKDLWSKAKSRLCGITPMMEFFDRHYGKKYAPNSRETVRRFTVHQFLQAGLIVENPDDPLRPTNSPKAVYQIEKGALELFRTFGTEEWEKDLQAYLATVKSLKKEYAREREMQKINIKFNNNQQLNLSTGGQNILIEKIIRIRTKICP